jgi:hypothetical protein
MATFNICKICINDFHQLFDDLVHSLVASLVDLGHECSVSINNIKPDAINILIGTLIADHLLTSSTLSAPYIVYQLEILDDELGHLKNYPNYLGFLSRALSVWDYSPKNIEFLKAKGIKNVEYVPPGYHAVCEKFNYQDSQHQFDFLFIGSYSPRRLLFLENLANKGCKVGAVAVNNSAFGSKRDQLIATSKVIVNVHCFDDLINLETARISYLLTNHAVVISEESDHDPYNGAIGYAKYDELVDYCMSALDGSPSLKERSDRGYEAIKAIDMRDLVRNALLAIKL